MKRSFIFDGYFRITGAPGSTVIEYAAGILSTGRRRHDTMPVRFISREKLLMVGEMRFFNKRFLCLFGFGKVLMRERYLNPYIIRHPNTLLLTISLHRALV